MRWNRWSVLSTRQFWCICALLLLTLAYCPAVSAGAWLQQPDRLLYATTQSAYSSHAYFDASGNRTAQPAFLKAESNHYLEYGYDEDWTLGANLFAQLLRQEVAARSEVSDNMGLADSELFAKYLVWKNDQAVLSLSPLIKLPSLYAHSALPKAGSDSMDAELSLMAGYGFSYDEGHHFVDARLGLRHRFDTALEDQIKFDIKLGYELYPNWFVIPAISLTAATATPSAINYSESGQNNYHLLKLEGTVLYKLDDRTYIQFGAFEHVAGRNTGEGVGALFGVGRQY